ncbi:hypothetical protein V474_02870 [Novosphingobium barchaimii LL02]|uniref:Uncharacterized protein n=1 Tax=Novosphingobium barchaimii LL02 TaxID=1114963 RepID=A0A0J7XK42_9SPHN|nr:DUF3237 domain-containing protein [Novosphingobium barchaimii]KMS52009.1 hypothetical protein V474_02870 [Novosphingobium barchaimii LL02]
MIELVPLCTISVELLPSLSVGTGPAGNRSVGGIASATVTGERLNAVLAGPAAADWLVRAGAIGVIDARLTLRTDDDALIYMTYGGRLDMSDPSNGIKAYTAPVFETGDPRYAWLNTVQAVGKGTLAIGAGGAGQLEYEICEVR